MKAITTGRVLRYMLLPEIAPRLRDFGRGAFVHIAYFMALIFRTAGLLPAGHPYLYPVNIGRYGIRHVLAQAAGNLSFRKDRIDQVVIFGLVLIGLALIVAQCCLLILAMFGGAAAFAQPFANSSGDMPTNFRDFFITPLPANDIAFVMLDRVFGISWNGGSTSFFDSCVGQGIPCFRNINPDSVAFPNPFHIAMHMMLQLYSIALMVVGVIILCYLIMVTIAETSKDGTPFGRRFNQVWVPLRLVMALGLLVPVSQGLNSAQYIVLYAAKWGSGFATNGWILFNGRLTDTYLGQIEDLIATPEIPEVNKLAQFFLTARTCYHARRMGTQVTTTPVNISGYLVGDPIRVPNNLPLLTTSYPAAMTFFNNDDMLISFGEWDTTRYYNQRGNVYPHCGQIRIPIVAVNEPGPRSIQEGYFQLIKDMWEDPQTDLYAQQIAQAFMPQTNNSAATLPDENYKNYIINTYGARVRALVDAGVAAQVASGDFLDPELLEFGWAGAAIWYNKIASMNGAVTTAIFNIPEVRLWSSAMETVIKERQQQDSNVASRDRYNPEISGDMSVDYTHGIEAEVNQSERWSHAFFEGQDAGVVREGQNVVEENAFIDAINLIFGTSGLFNIRKNENQNIHPLAQLSAVGKALVEASIRNLFIGGIGGVFSTFLGPMAGVASGFMVTIATLGLTVGFALFYVVPFLPFIYFFFALGTWIKGIFEAMVGVPLWALAHLRIDGEGMAGEAAMNGYYMIFEIFIRPILCVFGLLGSILIFAAMVKTLHEIFSLVIENLTGFDTRHGVGAVADPAITDIEFWRGPVDEFFFTIIYTIIVYMMGLSSFKMVDLVPNEILRWMGVSVRGFSDEMEDSTGTLMQVVAFGGSNTASLMGRMAGQTGTVADSVGKQIGILK
jgi:conjugal transfer/type IV secretion protein DotA/TraY